ncbi:MAG: hypothetical protein A3J65_02885 [Candidatus Buchananbacteria bacterium RIFCSPHIGHO2_02_FULL_45_11b]|uniref:Endolytic murein transglycosylase n=4 Tax=Candidatus Buchananiibacteriota TaxID=1817903 RepID=A0A1G1YIX5_9BACT|nr:MAG: hypothetical protein A2663_01890 [Candidatus Buchananbacteria bacterium RIFCSPHIGHO2_01_FULL_46_12]OGY52239.1 MAG: hypothetical protein A3J65_02885 [Candidatus Buchananbacteria bacterium RIFCSPHIGHO2_02_FULL_45_11b]OGY54355.1 MAG: hypothetical protein A3B15_02320 [Candidatus Buchananbacteria bacterium RIFCSPLOWO2_01_FULL_45_31]OGY57621.1 MAG: hypothetical protein A3H67_01630 [Candidatus Buchananbacteria bacterium RIFCSPLOWO2_02_FULL_46_11b]
MPKLIKYLILIIIPALLTAAGYYYYALNAPNSKSGEIKTFVIQPKQGSMVISRELKKAGLVKNWVVFELYVWAKGASSLLQPGEYDLPKNLTAKEIARILSRGAQNGALKEITLTFIEGWNNNDYAEYLNKQGFGQPEDFFAIVQKKQAWWEDYDFLQSRPLDRGLEGYLFPDTYRVYKNAAIKEIVQKMLDNFGRKLAPELRQEIAKQGKTVHEILTLASIIEKEVSLPADRKLAAGIFYRRLKNNIGLQSDATVNYITQKGAVQPSWDDTRIDSPYNTYKYKGLPPGPISHPGLDAILAAIYPAGNPYMYFLTTPAGEVIYSRTYEEHLAAKAKYLK